MPDSSNVPKPIDSSVNPKPADNAHGEANLTPYIFL